MVFFLAFLSLPLLLQCKFQNHNILLPVAGCVCVCDDESNRNCKLDFKKMYTCGADSKIWTLYNKMKIVFVLCY